MPHGHSQDCAPGDHPLENALPLTGPSPHVHLARGRETICIVYSYTIIGSLYPISNHKLSLSPIYDLTSYPANSYFFQELVQPVRSILKHSEVARIVSLSPCLLQNATGPVESLTDIIAATLDTTKTPNLLFTWPFLISPCGLLYCACGITLLKTN